MVFILLYFCNEFVRGFRLRTRLWGGAWYSHTVSFLEQFAQGCALSHLTFLLWQTTHAHMLTWTSDTEADEGQTLGSITSGVSGWSEECIQHKAETAGAEPAPAAGSRSAARHTSLQKCNTQNMIRSVVTQSARLLAKVQRKRLTTTCGRRTVHPTGTSPMFGR